MKNRRAIIRILLGIITLAAVDLVLSLGWGEKRDYTNRTALLDVVDDTVSLIRISRPGSTDTVLSRAVNWRLIEPFSADVDRQTVLKLLDALSYSSIDDKISDQELLRFGRTREDFGLDNPRLAVNVRSHVNETEISFGALTPSGKGVYAAIGGIPAVFVVSTNILAHIDVPAVDFRSRTLFSIAAESVAAFDIKRGGGGFLRLTREGGAWVMDRSDSAVRSSLVDELLHDLVSALAKNFVWTAPSPDGFEQSSAALFSTYGLDGESAVTVTLKGMDGVDRRILFGSEVDGGLVYALVNDGTAIVTVDRALKEKVMADADLFADMRLFPVDLSRTSGISLTLDGVTCLLARQENGSWRMDSPVAAPASAGAVEKLLAVLRDIRSDDIDSRKGVEIRVAEVKDPVKVSRRCLGDRFRLEDFRSNEIIAIDPRQVKRLSVFRRETGRTVSVVQDRERRAWSVEQSASQGAVSRKGVDAVLAALNPLNAVSVEKLKVTADDLRRCGLDEPRFRIAVDLESDDSIRRNILVGKEMREGVFYVTVGSSDAIFTLPAHTVADLTSELVE